MPYRPRFNRNRLMPIELTRSSIVRQASSPFFVHFKLSVALHALHGRIGVVRHVSPINKGSKGMFRIFTARLAEIAVQRPKLNLHSGCEGADTSSHSSSFVGC